MKDVPPQPKGEESVLGMAQSARSVPTKDAPPQPGVEDSVNYMGRIAKSAATNDQTWSKANTHDF